MSDIYELHNKAFARVSAYVILNNDGERVATVAFKFPADGSGRLWAYVHWLETPMVRSYAGGYGYDKRTAAVAAAAARIKPRYGEAQDAWEAACLQAFQAAVTDDASHWDSSLMRAGFTVLQAV